MIILSDIIMDDCTSDDIIVNGLAHYWDLTSKDLGDLKIVLRQSNEAVKLLSKMFCKDATFHINIACGDMNMSTRLPINANQLLLSSNISKMLMNKSVNINGDNNFKLVSR